MITEVYIKHTICLMNFPHKSNIISMISKYQNLKPFILYYITSLAIFSSLLSRQMGLEKEERKIITTTSNRISSSRDGQQ